MSTATRESSEDAVAVAVVAAVAIAVCAGMSGREHVGMGLPH